MHRGLPLRDLLSRDGDIVIAANGEAARAQSVDRQDILRNTARRVPGEVERYVLHGQERRRSS